MMKEKLKKNFQDQKWFVISEMNDTKKAKKQSFKTLNLDANVKNVFHL